MADEKQAAQAAKKRRAVRVELAYVAPVRHPIKAARLLYSAPSWVLSGPIYLISMIVFSSLAYSFWATKDELVVVPLTLERESVTTESVVGGIVHKIYVQEGTHIDARQMLMDVKMNTVMRNPETDAIQSRLADLEKKSMDDEAAFDAKKGRLKIKYHQWELSLKGIDKDKQLLEEDLGDAERNVRHLNSRLGSAQKEEKKMRRLLKNRDITQPDYDRVKARVDDLNKSIMDAESRQRKIMTSLRALDEEKIRSEMTLVGNEMKEQLERYEKQRARSEEKKAEWETRLVEAEELGSSGAVDQGRLMTSYKSFFSGLVSRIHVKQGKTIGVGEPLVTIVKDSAALSGRALVENKDIGRMKWGQPVSVKYFAYPYQEYGIPTGTITNIATKPGGVSGKESKYMVRVTLDKDTIAKRGGVERRLEIGLEGIAEIKTGQKRFIELVFSPISRFFDPEEN